LKGWSINIESAQNRMKQSLVAEYDLLDVLSESQTLSTVSKTRISGRRKKLKLDKDQEKKRF
jgi:hypothetical protein